MSMSTLEYVEAPLYRDRAAGDPLGVFLAGGITGCPRWHDDALSVLGDSGVPMIVYSPNRLDFPIHDPAASEEQVTWEQHYLRHPGVLTLFWFPKPIDPHIVQPIALFELGQAIGEGRSFVVGVDPEYPRARDVRFMMKINHAGQPVYDTLGAVLNATIDTVSAGLWA